MAVANGEATGGGAELALVVHDGGRDRTESVEQVTAMAAEAAESDAPPAVELHAAGSCWLSSNGGTSWHAHAATDEPSSATEQRAIESGAAETGSGLPPRVDANGSPGRRTGVAANGRGADRTSRAFAETNGAAPPAPPGCGAAPVPLTLTEDDRAALGVPRRYAAGWPTEQGVVLGTSAGDGSWGQTMVAVPGGNGPCAMTPTADGVLLACTDGLAIRCRRVPLEAVIGEGTHAQAAASNWHHDSADLIATLKERQPAGTR